MSDTAPYLQRNTGPDPVDVPAIPATVAPGDAVLWPHPIAGFEPAADAPSPSTDPVPDAPAKTTRTRTAAAGEE